MLEVNNLYVGDYKDLNIIQDLSIRARSNQITAVLGANGVGKSTALKAIFGFLRPNEGEVLLGPLGRAKGRDQIRSLMETALDGAVGTSFHVISSPMIALRGDTATSDVMWTVVHRKEDGHPSLSMIGRHRDELVREDGRWRFLKRRGFVDIPSAMS